MVPPPSPSAGAGGGASAAAAESEGDPDNEWELLGDTPASAGAATAVSAAAASQPLEGLFPPPGSGAGAWPAPLGGNSPPLLAAFSPPFRLPAQPPPPTPPHPFSLHSTLSAVGGALSSVHSTVGGLLGARSGTWCQIGLEGETLAVPAGSLLRYGRRGLWVEKEVPTSTEFVAGNEYFGRDPCHGVQKCVQRLYARSAAGQAEDGAGASPMVTEVTCADMHSIPLTRHNFADHLPNHYFLGLDKLLLALSADAP